MVHFSYPTKKKILFVSKILGHTVPKISWSQEFVRGRGYRRTDSQIHTKNFVYLVHPESYIHTKFQAFNHTVWEIVLTRFFVETRQGPRITFPISWNWTSLRNVGKPIIKFLYDEESKKYADWINWIGKKRIQIAEKNDCTYNINKNLKYLKHEEIYIAIIRWISAIIPKSKENK